MERENKVLVTEVNSLKHHVERIRVEKDGIGEDLIGEQDGFYPIKQDSRFVVA